MATEIMIFETKDNEIKLTVPVENETVWLTRSQMAQLFDRDISVIGRHIRNIFEEGELAQSATVAKFATTAICNI